MQKANLIFQSTLVIIALIALVVGVVAGISTLRIVMASTNKTMASSIASILNAIQIQGMTVIYGAIADALTDRENHRTDTEYEDSLIAKVFMFQFVNSYASLFYVAFIQQSLEGLEVSFPPLSGVRCLSDPCTDPSVLSPHPNAATGDGPTCAELEHHFHLAPDLG
jgi:hypothetical protein